MLRKIALALVAVVAVITESAFGQNHDNKVEHAQIEEIDSLMLVAESLYDKKEYIAARKIYIELNEKVENVYGNNNAVFLSILLNLSNIELDLKNYKECIKYSSEALSIIKDMDTTDELTVSYYLLSLTTIIQAEYQTKEYAEALQLYDLNRLFIERHHNNAAINGLIGWISQIYISIGNNVEAIHLLENLINDPENVIEQEWLICHLLQIANCYSRTGNTVDAIKTQTRVVKLASNYFGETSSKYALSVRLLSDYYLELKDYNNAEKFCDQAITIYQLSNTQDEDFARALCAKAHLLGIRKDYEGALAYYNSALKISTTGGKQISATMQIAILDNISHMIVALKAYDLALTAESHAWLLAQQTYGKFHPSFISISTWLLSIYHLAKKMDSNPMLAQLLYQSTADILLINFKSSTIADRNNLWDQYKLVYQNLMHQNSYYYATNDNISIATNSSLLSKGILLNSEIEFIKLIQESGDTIAVEMFNDLKMRHLQINKLIEKPIAERFANVDSLETEAQKVEKALIDRSKAYGDYTKNLVITWEQVQEKLTKNDIAVEFVSFPLNADSTMYVAYTIRKDWDNPRMTVLFEEKQLLSVSDKFGTDSISKLVWQPLDEQLEDVQNVYFSPGGELYNIAIESIPTHIDGGKMLVSEHNRRYYRLSSTRELALIKDEIRWNEAAVYGGLQYNLDVDEMIQEDKKYDRRSDVRRGDSTPQYYIVREDTTTRDDRGTIQGLAYLEGTKAEAEAIKQDLDSKSVAAQLFTDKIGTETSFKDLSGRRKSIVHIATHGFFNDRKKEYTGDNFLSLLDRQPTVIEDDAMTRSGLYFAGADNVRKHVAIPDSIDDGKLTAMEIAQLDLRGLDLVVLSACQTGLGEITGDGVFGLQRGFKKAGAQTIVMSLWKVDDNATQLFMTQFFKRIRLDANGRPTNKYEAFSEAQSYVRNYTADDGSHPFAKPEYWAAFIMLDGI